MRVGWLAISALSAAVAGWTIWQFTSQFKQAWNAYPLSSPEGFPATVIRSYHVIQTNQFLSQVSAIVLIVALWILAQLGKQLITFWLNAPDHVSFDPPRHDL